MPPISLLRKSKSTAEPAIKAACDIKQPKNVTEFIKEKDYPNMGIRIT